MEDGGGKGSKDDPPPPPQSDTGHRDNAYEMRKRLEAIPDVRAAGSAIERGDFYDAGTLEPWQLAHKYGSDQGIPWDQLPQHVRDAFVEADWIPETYGEFLPSGGNCKSLAMTSEDPILWMTTLGVGGAKYGSALGQLPGHVTTFLAAHPTLAKLVFGGLTVGGFVDDAAMTYGAASGDPEVQAEAMVAFQMGTFDGPAPLLDLVGGLGFFGRRSYAALTGGAETVADVAGHLDDADGVADLAGYTFHLGDEGWESLASWGDAGDVTDAAEAALQTARQTLPDAGGPRLLPPGNPTSLADQPRKLLAAPEMRYAPPESGHPIDLQRAIVAGVRETGVDYAAFRGMTPVSEWGWAGRFPSKPVGAKTLPGGKILDSYGRDTGLRWVKLQDGTRTIVRTDLDPAWAIRGGQGIPDPDFMDPLEGLGPAINRRYLGEGDPIVQHGTHIEGVKDPAIRDAGASPAYLTHPVYVYGPYGYIETGPMRQTYQQYRLGR
ncbi:MAG: hypothetical protein DRJ03_25605 [Chloroflexi bacterium]|nr:MAG: hypothetical protein DRJ03_25605 [Chloroflexota bacterium]